MIGYNVSWAAFSIVEVMSQTRFAHKRVGYLAANQVVTLAKSDSAEHHANFSKIWTSIALSYNAYFISVIYRIDRCHFVDDKSIQEGILISE